MLRWVNKVAFLDDGALAAKHPHVRAIIHDVAKEYGFTAPSVGIIPDRNPTAFTYGLLRSNARIILTDGIFEFLTEDETRAVVAHELGHIVNRDFLVMTVAGMLVQMLYQVFAAFTRAKPSGGDKKGNQLVIVGIIAYVLYTIGIYVLLYLSRTREYLADRFAAEHVEARHLCNALVKIAYGIAEAADTEASRDLLAGTRHLGVVDVKNARHLGLVAENTKAEPSAMASAMLFDVYNPWARWIELSSTHPLTGRRIQHLAAVATELKQPFPEIDIAGAAKKAGLDEGQLRSKFVSEIGVVVSPIIAGIAVALLGAWPLAPAAAAIVWLMTVSWRYPGSTPEATQVVDLMGDYAASPIRGRAVKLTGTPIGRADAGSVIGEDLVFADKTGRIVTDFRSMLGPIGNLFAGWKRVKKHIGAEGEVTGWFRRSMGGYVIMRRLTTTQGDLRARPYFWDVALGVIVIAVSVIGWLAYIGSTTTPY
jgi:Zn-dependent protease with chaperone function